MTDYIHQTATDSSGEHQDFVGTAAAVASVVKTSRSLEELAGLPAGWHAIAVHATASSNHNTLPVSWDVHVLSRPDNGSDEEVTDTLVHGATIDDVVTCLKDISIDLRRPGHELIRVRHLDDYPPQDD